MRHRVFQLSLVTAAAALIAYFWPISRKPLITVMDSGNRWGMINTDGRSAFWLDSALQNIGVIDEAGMIPVTDGKFFGWVDRRGDTVIPISFLSATDPFAFPEFDASGVAHVVDEEGETLWIDRAGNSVGEPERREEIRGVGPKGLAVCREGDSWGWIDKAGNRFGAWEAVYDFDEHGMAPFRSGGRWGWCDTRGKIVIPPKWEIERDSWDFMKANPTGTFDQMGWAQVSDGSALLWIDRTGEIMLRSEWRYASTFDENGLAIVGPKHALEIAGWMNRKGELVIPAEGNATRRQNEASGYYVAFAYLSPSWLAFRTHEIANGFRKSPRDFPPYVMQCHCYDKSGALVWSSLWLTFETKCLIALSAALAVGFLTRPWKRHRRLSWRTPIAESS